jgi:hypothetical protein
LFENINRVSLEQGQRASINTRIVANFHDLHILGEMMEVTVGHFSEGVASLT